MIKVEIPRKFTVGVTPFRWGMYFHLRIGRRWWHLKVGFWYQNGLRISTRAQKFHGRKRRYVDALRFNVSFWRTKDGKELPPFSCGIMVYGGKTK